MIDNVKTKKVVKGMASYFSDVKKIKLGQAKIDFLLLNVPPACNYRCKKCFTSAESRKAVTPLSLKEWLYLIEEGKNGYMIYEQNPELFADKIIEVWNDKQKYIEISKYAQEYARQYDIKPYVEKLLALYQKAIDEKLTIKDIK